MSFVAKSVTLSGGFELELPVEEAFPLFSPIGEERWAPDWKVEVLHPKGAEWEQAMVWRTVDDPDVIWFVGSLDRVAHRATYHRAHPGSMAVTIAVACTPRDRGTRVEVSYTYVGISDEGNSEVEKLATTNFSARMREWRELITAGLTLSPAQS